MSAMTELGKQTVEFSALVRRAAEESFLSLKQLVENAKSTELSDTDKKISLLKYVVKTRQRMLRLNALAGWCKQVPLINYCRDLGSTLSSHDISFTQAADSLFFMHEGLQQARAPVYDVPSAIEVLLTGSYQRLPRCLDDVGMHCSLDEHQQKPTLRKLEVLVRSKLLETTLPKEITEVKVSKGTVTLSVEGEFKVLVTLGYRGHLSMWRILHLDLLVGERRGPIKLEVLRRHIIGDDLERRMSVAQNPFTVLYAVLHELCVAIAMDTVIRQVRSLLQGRWKYAICFDLILDSGTTPAYQEGEADYVSLQTPGVQLMYWSDSDKFSGPFIKIEPDSDLQIRCFHSTFVIDPLTGKEAEFSLNPSCIDVEKLLLKAICCNRYTRLLEIQRELLRNAHICRTSGDVILQSLLDDPVAEEGNMVDSEKRVEPEVLLVRAYGSSFISLGINIRSGRFLLQSSKSILTPSVLKKYEDALNQGSISAADAFINLRSKSILHIFAAIGKFLGLEVCDHGFGINKVSKTLLDESNVLTLGFPDCESSHFLLIELEKDFSPSFELVETQVDGSGKPQSFNDLGNVSRVQKIDIGQIWVLENDLNLFTSDTVRFVSSFSDPEGLNQASGHHQSGLIDEALEEMSGSQLSFSSIVDEAFGHQKGTSAAGNGLSDSGGSLVTESSLSPFPISDFAITSDGLLLRKDEKSRKLSASDLIPSIQGVEGVASPNKRQKTSELVQSESVKSRSPSSQTLSTAVATSTKTVERSYGNLISEANKGNAPSSVFVYALLHVVRHSSFSIKHAKLTCQMEALDISYVEKMGIRNVIADIWFRLPFAQNVPWQHICLQLGRPGNMSWDVKINDQYFRDLWELRKGSKTTPWGSGVHIANSSDVNSHMRYDHEGVVLSYQSVEADSIKKLLADIQRLLNARIFSLGMRKLLGIKPDERTEEGSANPAIKGPTGRKGSGEPVDLRRAFKIDAVGLTSLWFRFGSGGLARFFVEWESGRDGCTMHVSPDQLWPHTKFMEEFINGAKVESLLECIRLTTGPLLALSSATRHARNSEASDLPVVPVTASSKQSNQIQQTQRFISPSTLASPNVVGQSALVTSGNTAASPASTPFCGVAKLAAAGRSRLGNVPNSLLPTDVTVVLHGPYWIRFFYRKCFAVDMRCFVGDRVWLQPATPPKDGGASIGGSLPCPQFRQFIRERVAQELNSGLGDDGGYGGGWVPLVALKRVLCGIFKYLGVLWLFAQLPDLVREILGSILKDNEGAVVNIEQEQPALRFFVRGYSFLVSVHRFQLLLQIRSVRRSHQQQQNDSSSSAHEELTQSEIQDICDYFSRHVASEPYDVSRVASFITLLTLPILVLREFLKLIAWKKGLSQSQQAGEIASAAQRPRIELCLENHSGTDSDSSCAATKSNIQYDRLHNTVDFALIVVLDPAHIPQTNEAGGAAWLPCCVSVRLRYTFGDNPGVTFIRMEGSHGGQACWQRVDDWEKCKQRVSHTVEINGSAAENLAEGRLKSAADSVQRTLQVCLQRS